MKITHHIDVPLHVVAGLHGESRTDRSVGLALHVNHTESESRTRLVVAATLRGRESRTRLVVAATLSVTIQTF